MSNRTFVALLVAAVLAVLLAGGLLVSRWSAAHSLGAGESPVSWHG